MLSDKEYRKNVVQNIKDPAVKSFWVDEFAKYTDKFAAEATPAIQNKVGQFTSNPLIRNIIGQPKSSFDLRKVLDEKKILIVNLSKGRVGEGNANLLGSMLITKIYLAALSRADMPESVVNKLPNFYLYVDEFQSFANESFADILSEARKYKLNLTMAHQYIEQMSEEVRAAVFGNIGTMITFRVGAFDAEVLEKEFAPQFTAEDLVNLGFTQVYMKLMIDGVSSHPFSATTLPPIEKQSVSFRDSVIVESRRQFGVERQDVEDEIVTQMGSHGAQAPTTHIPQENKSTLANRGIPQGAPNHEPQKKVEGSPISNLRSALASVLTNEELPPLSNHSKQMAVSGGLKENTGQEKNKDGGMSHVPRVNEVPRRDGHLQTHSGNTQRSFGAPHGDRHPTQQSSKPTHGLSHEKGKSLKEALGEILKKMPEKLDEHKANQVEPKAMHVSATKEEKVSEERKPHEIPEDELKKMLEVPPQQ